MKAIFMGTPEFSIPSLEALVESVFNVELVVTQPDRPKGRGKKLQAPAVKIKALEYGIEVYQPERINTKEAIDKIKSINPDLIIVVAFGQILPKEILDLPKYGCINVHASLLPKYRGAAPINFSVINAEEKTGITTMYMEVGLDTGDMLIKKEIDILENDTAASLHDKLAELGRDALSETIEALLNGTINPIKQDDELSCYAPIMTKDLGKIKWDASALEIANLIKGTDPWPSAYSYYDGNMVKLSAPSILDKLSNDLPGTIVDVSNQGIDIATKDKVLRILEIQISGKKRMMVSEFLKGNALEIGKVLSNE